MVKKFLSAIAVLAILFTACETPNEEAKSKFHITSETLIETSASGNCFVASYVIDEVVEGVTVTATSSAEWIHLNGEITESEILFCTDDNYGEARTGTLDVKYADSKQSITITQRRNKITIECTTFDVPADATCINATYIINEVVEGAMVYAIPSDDWFHINGDITESEIPFCVDSNEGEARTGTLRIDYDGDPAVITINQAAPIAE